MDALIASIILLLAFFIIIQAQFNQSQTIQQNTMDLELQKQALAIADIMVKSSSDGAAFFDSALNRTVENKLMESKLENFEFQKGKFFVSEISIKLKNKALIDWKKLNATNKCLTVSRFVWMLERNKKAVLGVKVCES